MTGMATIKFTASIVKRDKGCYVAHADELPVVAAPATTQRGAIKNLKDAVLGYLRRAAQEGRLANVLDDAGYGGGLIYFPDATLECHNLDTPTLLLRLPRQRKSASRKNGKQPESEREGGLSDTFGSRLVTRI